MSNVIMGAKYASYNTGDVVTVTGYASKHVVCESGGHQVSILYKIFVKEYADTGIHDHENFCCVIHKKHVMPHKGCLLR